MPITVGAAELPIPLPGEVPDVPGDLLALGQRISRTLDPVDTVIDLPGSDVWDGWRVVVLSTPGAIWESKSGVWTMHGRARFSNSTARTAAIPAPQLDMRSHLDLDATDYRWDGTAWIPDDATVLAAGVGRGSGAVFRRTTFANVNSISTAVDGDFAILTSVDAGAGMSVGWYFVRVNGLWRLGPGARISLAAFPAALAAATNIVTQAGSTFWNSDDQTVNVWTGVAGQYLPISKRPIAKLSRTTAMTIPSGAYTAINWLVEDFDPDGMHAGSSSIITLPLAGIYRIAASVGFNPISATVGLRAVINGSAIPGGGQIEHTVNDATVSLDTLHSAGAGDVLTIEIQQNSGSDKTTSTTVVNARPQVTVEWLRPA